MRLGRDKRGNGRRRFVGKGLREVVLPRTSDIEKSRRFYDRSRRPHCPLRDTRACGFRTARRLKTLTRSRNTSASDRRRPWSNRRRSSRGRTTRNAANPSDGHFPAVDRQHVPAGRRPCRIFHVRFGLGSFRPHSDGLVDGPKLTLESCREPDYWSVSYAQCASYVIRSRSGFASSSPHPHSRGSIARVRRQWFIDLKIPTTIRASFSSPEFRRFLARS